MATTSLTKNAIRAGMLDLLDERPLNQITVNDIAEKCGISRNTFYYHYHDVYELIEETCNVEFDRVMEEYTEITSLGDCLDAVMHFAREHKRAVMHIYSSDNRNAFVDSLWRICEHVVITYLGTVFHGVDISSEDREIFIEYFKSSTFGLIIGWINTGMNDESIDRMHRVCRKGKGIAELIISNLQDPTV